MLSGGKLNLSADLTVDDKGRLSLSDEETLKLAVLLLKKFGTEAPWKWTMLFDLPEVGAETEYKRFEENLWGADCYDCPFKTHSPYCCSEHESEK